MLLALASVTGHSAKRDGALAGPTGHSELKVNEEIYSEENICMLCFPTLIKLMVF